MSFLDFIFKLVFFWLTIQFFMNENVKKLCQSIIDFLKDYSEQNFKKHRGYKYIKHKDGQKSNNNVIKEDQNLNNHIIKEDQKFNNHVIKEEKNDDNNSDKIKIDKTLAFESKKFAGSEYDIEKIYSIKFNHIGNDRPNENVETGYIWFNTKNNTINIYYDHNFHEFPILNKSIVKQYIKRQPINSNNKLAII